MEIKSWMVIGGVTLGVGFLGSTIVRPRGLKWFRRLRRPRWLTFEPAIPLIWTVIFICGAWSATIVWERNPGTATTWSLMGLYLLLELVTLAYNSVMLNLQHLRVGTVIGATGLFLSLLLTALVYPISGWAALLLLPYILWSPIGTYVTWAMERLNPMDV